MKVLITSDNHLGYKENDEIRGEDSFNTFEEILVIANKENVDFIIQGGDLFHDNRPTRYCIDKTIQLLSKYCTGKKKTQIKEIKRLNKMTESVSITIPMLAIHGNHDDPSGINRISTLNILHSAGLISYIGQYRTESIIVEPIVIKNIALYAIGHIKDRLLYKSFLEGRVVFKRSDNYKDYYNILVLHQNRVQRNKEYVPETILEDFFDLVIYGHEHDSSITKGRFVVLQCGSTVRTSLCESETEDKYCYILELKESSSMRFPTINKIKLQTVREFKMDTIRVEEDNLEMTVETHLNKMIETILKNKQVIEKPKRSKMSNESDGNITRIIEEPIDVEWDKKILLPLIRLRVETYGLKILNNHKIGLKYKDKVANPNDMIRFIRKRVIKNVKKSEISTSLNIYDILKSNLHDLNAIPEEKFIDSLENFVNKDDKESFNILVQQNVDRLVSKIDLNKMMLDDLENEIKRINKDEFRKSEECLVHLSNSDNESSSQMEENNVTKFEEKILSRNSLPLDTTDKNNNNSSTIQLSSFNCSTFITENSDDKIKLSDKKENVSFLTSASNSIFKDLSYEKQSFSGKNSKEARKVLNSLKVEKNVQLDEKETVLPKRMIIDENEIIAEDKEEKNSKEEINEISLEESSTDFLFDF